MKPVFQFWNCEWSGVSYAKWCDIRWSSIAPQQLVMSTSFKAPKTCVRSKHLCFQEFNRVARFTLYFCLFIFFSVSAVHSCLEGKCCWIVLQLPWENPKKICSRAERKTAEISYSESKVRNGNLPNLLLRRYGGFHSILPPPFYSRYYIT